MAVSMQLHHGLEWVEMDICRHKRGCTRHYDDGLWLLSELKMLGVERDAAGPRGPGEDATCLRMAHRHRQSLADARQRGMAPVASQK